MTMLGARTDGAEAWLEDGAADQLPKHPAAGRPTTGTRAAHARFTSVGTRLLVETSRDGA
jgi:hypothetical protein